MLDLIFLILKWVMVGVYILTGLCLAIIIFGFLQAFYSVIILGNSVL